MIAPIRIAIAEDHELVRTGLVEMFDSLNDIKVVAEAQNGFELINKLVSIKEPPDICVLDVSMPVLNGYDTVCALRQLYPEMKYLALSVFEHEYSIVKMIKNGANGYLSKNTSFKELQKAITAIYKQGFYYSNIASLEAFIAVKQTKPTELTEKDINMLSLFCSEQSYQQIAEHLNVSVRTIQDYQDIVGSKLNIKTRLGLVLFALQSGLVPLRKL